MLCSLAMLCVHLVCRLLTHCPLGEMLFLVPKQTNQTLLKLNLFNNQIGDVGAAALGEGIAVSCVACWLLAFFVVGYLSSPGNPRHFCDFGAAEEHDAQGAKLGVQQDW